MRKSEPIGLESAGQQAAVEPMSIVTEALPFGFDVVSVGRDAVTVTFVSEGRITTPPYVGVKGTRDIAEKESDLQYVLEYDKEYSFVYTVMDGDTEVVYNSFITVQQNGTPEVVFGEVVRNIINSASARATGTVYESESNNTMATADTTQDDYDSIGALTSTSDVDYWKVTFLESGRANFWLGNIPAGCNYDLSVFNSAGVEIGYSMSAGQTAELITLNVSAGTYYIKITSYSGFSSSTYLCRAKWYPGRVLDVPLYVQETEYTCSCASGRMVLAYYGVYVSETVFYNKANQIGGDYWNAMWVIRDTVNYYLDNAGINTSYVADWFSDEESYLECMLANILEGYPVVINQAIYDDTYYPYEIGTDGHYVVVTGMVYDSATASYTVIINDPHYAYWGEYEIPFSGVYYCATCHQSGPFMMYVIN